MGKLNENHQEAVGDVSLEFRSVKTERGSSQSFPSASSCPKISLGASEGSLFISPIEKSVGLTINPQQKL